MKKIFIISAILISYSIMGQVSNYNQFRNKRPSEFPVLPATTNVSFAYSLRTVNEDYTGPLIRLRRASDNAQLDFSAADNNIVDIDAINTWRAGANVFVTTWYDQSDKDVDAIQTNNGQQPQLIPDVNQPYVVGDGANDVLFVQESVQVVTNAGKNGSVLGVFLATDRADTAFGVSAGTRWLTHINWSNEQCFFDPGYCCNNPRSFTNNLPTNVGNPGSLGIWDQYSFVRRDNPADTTTDRVIMRLGSVEKVNGGFPDFRRCTLNVNFGICAATNAAGNGTSYSNTRIAEFIMFNEGLSDDEIIEIEQNQIQFWGL